ncbi:MAG: hypothetical protein COB04_10965 [Gammaproteobacteria bacterium]|nr:MAG: hypothetical protein COB04_10965 [Gammaproteobacteria bacterium]
MLFTSPLRPAALLNSILTSLTASTFLFACLLNSAHANKEPICYLKASTNFDSIAEKPTLTRGVKISSYATAGTSVVLAAPTLGASLPLGMFASATTLAASDLRKHMRLGDRERFMGIMLEAQSYEKKKNAGLERPIKDYPLMSFLDKRANGFFRSRENLDSISAMINSLNSDPEFCNDSSNMRFVHLKDRVLGLL